MLIVIRASSLRGGVVSIPRPVQAAGGRRLPPGTLSRESLSCSCHPESSLGLVSQDRGGVCWGREHGSASPWEKPVDTHPPNTHTHTGGFSQCESYPSGQRASVTPRSLAGCSLSTPIGSELISSIPSSVKPAFSSQTYFPNSAVLEQCLALFPL